MKTTRWPETEADVSKLLTQTLGICRLILRYGREDDGIRDLITMAASGDTEALVDLARTINDCKKLGVVPSEGGEE